MRRHAAGIIALILLLLAAAMWYWPPIADAEVLQGGCLRGAAVFAAVWLAYDQVQRMPGWLLALLPVFLVLLVIRPRWCLYALPIVILLAILRPRGRRK